MSSTKRHSTLPSIPKPPTSLHPTCVIADLAILSGTHLITIGANTVIHPRARLNSSHGPITIGANCIVCERSVVGAVAATSDEEQKLAVDAERGVVIRDAVNIEPGAVVEGWIIGEGSVVEVNARVLDGAVLGKHCKIAALCEVARGERLPDRTVIYGDGRRRLDRMGPVVEKLRVEATERHVQVLKKLIPTNLAKWERS